MFHEADLEVVVTRCTRPCTDRDLKGRGEALNFQEERPSRALVEHEVKPVRVGCVCGLGVWDLLLPSVHP